MAIDVCASCGHAVFPPRPLCPHCAARDWRTEIVREGFVEATTEVRHRTREERRMPVGGWRDLRRVPLASVRLEAGPLVIAWSPDDAPRGSRVRLETRSGVPVARLPSRSAR